MLHFKTIQDFNNSACAKNAQAGKPRKKPVQKEHFLQVKIVNWLLQNNIYHFAIPNGGSRNKAEGAKLKREGVRAGVSDLIVLLPSGRAIFLELKVDNNKQQYSQIQFQKDVEELGFKYYLVKSLEEVQKILG